MLSNHYSFGQDGFDGRRTGAPLPPPFTDASARDVACGIHAALIEVGLTPPEICEVACVLITLSGIDERGDASAVRGSQRENRP